MFLSWVRRPLFEFLDKVNKAGAVDKVAAIFKAVHKLRILHHNAEPRNILFSAISDNIMAVDFEHAEFHGRQPLGSKRRRRLSQKQEEEFVSELEHAVAKVSGFM